MVLFIIKTQFIIGFCMFLLAFDAVFTTDFQQSKGYITIKFGGMNYEPFSDERAERFGVQLRQEAQF